MFGLSYIKKEDVEYYEKQRNKVLGVMYLAFSVVFAVIYWLVVPKMSVLFDDLGTKYPWEYVMIPYYVIFIAICSLILGVVYITKKVDKETLRVKLQKYKSGEMIRVNLMYGMSDIYIFLGFFAVSSVLLYTLVIPPVYRLTESLQ